MRPHPRGLCNRSRRLATTGSRYRVTSKNYYHSSRVLVPTAPLRCARRVGIRSGDSRRTDISGEVIKSVKTEAAATTTTTTVGTYARVCVSANGWPKFNYQTKRNAAYGLRRERKSSRNKFLPPIVNYYIGSIKYLIIYSPIGLFPRAVGLLETLFVFCIH